MFSVARHDVLGVELTREDLAELGGMSLGTVHSRLHRGMSPLAVVAIPVANNNGVTMIGRRFGRLVVVREDGRTKANKPMFACECDCGEPRTVVGADLRSGRTTSCGCARIEAVRATRESEAEDLTGQVFADGGVRVLGPGGLVLTGKGHGERRNV